MYVSSFQLQVIDKTKGIADIPEWFAGSRLNFAENLLKYDDDNVAIYSCGNVISFVICIYIATITHVTILSIYLSISTVCENLD